VAGVNRVGGEMREKGEGLSCPVLLSLTPATQARNWSATSRQDG